MLTSPEWGLEEAETTVCVAHACKEELGGERDCKVCGSILAGKWSAYSHIYTRNLIIKEGCC